jgi:hypothetical protein
LDAIRETLGEVRFEGIDRENGFGPVHAVALEPVFSSREFLKVDFLLLAR